MGEVMNLHNFLDNVDETELTMCINMTASDYFRNIYYSKQFSSIVDKLSSKDELSEEEWKYLTSRLYIVTCKATMEEDSLSIADRIRYLLNKIITKILKNGKVYNECVKILAFIESIKLEGEINMDLLECLERVEKSKKEIELEVLLKQHREASIFRDNQDAFINLYMEGETGIMTSDELLYIDCMDRAYIREKDLVKEYKQWYNLDIDGDIGVVINIIL